MYFDDFIRSYILIYCIHYLLLRLNAAINTFVNSYVLINCTLTITSISYTNILEIYTYLITFVCMFLQMYRILLHKVQSTWPK